MDLKVGFAFVSSKCKC